MHFDVFILAFLFLCFIWSGFVRTGFGFGGNALMLPIALLVISDPLVIIPVTAVQAMLFSGFEVARNFKKVDWKKVGIIFLIISPAFAAGLYGLINLPDRVLTLAIYAITIAYGLSYIFQIKVRLNCKLLDLGSLLLGGYITGFALSGSPPIVAVAMKYIPKNLLRNSLLTFWILVGATKLITLGLAQIDLQLFLNIFSLPAVILGHYLGLKFHDHILKSQKFYRLLGGVLLFISIIGILKITI